jgi:hypothetical protein
MEPESREPEAVVFRTGNLDGHRLIEVEFPSRLDPSRLVTIIDPYFALWDDDVPTLQIVDVRRCEGLDDAAFEFLKLLVRRTVHQANYCATSWIVGENERIASDVTLLLACAVHTTDGIVQTWPEAAQHLRRFLSARSPGQG